MRPLRELQRQFAAALHDPDVAVPAVRAHGLSAARRVQVYRNNSRAALSGALHAVFPVTVKLVGEEFFASAAAAYVRSHPSRSGNIQDYGEGFPDLLRGFAPAASLPYLGDVAMLEWERLQSAQAAPHTNMDVRALGRVPEERQPSLRFNCQPAARIIASTYPILSIWQFCQSPADDLRPDLDQPGERVLIARPELDVYMRRLGPGEYALLQALFAGAIFEQACAQALDAEPACDVPGLFATLAQEQILTGFFL